MNAVLAIQLTTSSGKSEAFTIEGERIRIGSAAYCEVRLPLGEAAPEQLAIEHRGVQGLYAEVLSFEPTPTLNGSPFTLAPLMPSSTIRLGAIEIQAQAVAAVATGPRFEARQKSNPLVYVAAAVVLPVAVWQLTLPDDQEELGVRAAPALFPGERVNCPQSERDSAHALAREQRRLAESKQERSPFHTSDGVRAVGIYRLAEACFAAAGDSDEAQQAQRDAAALERHLTDRYRTHRVRLEHALSINNYAMARREVRALLDLTEGKADEYVSWLSSLDRRLALREATPS